MTNKAIILGRLGGDVETSETQGGQRYCRMSVATSRRWTDKASGEKREKTSWHRVVVWGNELANLCAQRLRKGSQVYVEGEIETRKWQGRDGRDQYTTEIVVQGLRGQVVFVDRSEGGQPPEPDPPEGWRDMSMAEA